MRMEDFLKNAAATASIDAGAEAAVKYLSTTVKTEGLIRMMAEDRYFRQWSDAEIAHVIRETGVFDFSIDDILLVHRLMHNEQYIQKKQEVNCALEHMKTMQSSGRFQFYRNEVIPKLRMRDAIMCSVASDFNHLLYYAEKAKGKEDQ